MPFVCVVTLSAQALFQVQRVQKQLDRLIMNLHMPSSSMWLCAHHKTKLPPNKLAEKGQGGAEGVGEAGSDQRVRAEEDALPEVRHAIEAPVGPTFDD